ncbi:MAG: S-adenosylmethionine:tRNA ribosyltransferase-isomerase [Ignavibacteriae bacterium]|nr:S-adenosylmethionine:tRNA ribosyltransferase-isomerase [Ignavibacteriota bacterium]MCB9217232.1 S-adenosylmethionine:tRNA ribosyltransferase-isomerase [Ignavibacteria bacterium]
MERRPTEIPIDLPHIALADFQYELPPEAIPDHPVEPRDSSRLLCFDARTNHITHHHFHDLPSLIPSGSRLIVNDTRVVRARIQMQRESGGSVEVLLLDPTQPSVDPAITLASRGECYWHCMVGGLKKFRKTGVICLQFESLEGEKGILTANYVGESEGEVLIRFQWTPEALSFSEVLESAGHIPLPPYIKRGDQAGDAESYQTVYAEEEGAVAAPTAGLHFTPTVLERLKGNGVEQLQLTLHVGAGTFAPVKTARAEEHVMHGERIALSKKRMQSLVEVAQKREREGCPVVHVGTTSLRTMETLYWFGVGLLRGEVDPAVPEIRVGQWDAWRRMQDSGRLPEMHVAFEEVLNWSERQNLEALRGKTELMIIPGLSVMTCDALITNFHQPGSTLMLLVAAFLEGDLWKKVYSEARLREYRFLSYGDSSLLIRSRFPK